jgi:outer membrane protein
MRIYHIVKAITAGFICFIWLGSALAADVAKIGTVDIQRIMSTSEQGKAAKAKIKEQTDQMTVALKQKGAEIENLKNQLERESMVMSKEKREEKEREFRIKLNDLKTLEKRYRGDLQAIEKKLAGEMRKAVFKLVEEIGKKEGYLLIMNNFNIMYAPSSIDITDKIIKKLNAQYKK